MTARSEELETALRGVRARIERAVQATGRTSAPTLIAVTKYFPATDLDLLASLGVRDIAESKDQEAAGKLAQAAARERLTVHFVGQLQTNKARSVARYADVVHSVDRLRLITALDHGAAQAGRTLEVLLQVCLEEQAGRGGALPQDLPALASAAAGATHLRLRGVMAVAPRKGDPAVAFAQLAQIAHDLQAEHPDAALVSAGMSGDLEAAIAAGATHLRVGSAILGTRPSHE